MDVTTIADYIQEVVHVGREVEYYKGKFYDVVPLEQRVSYAQSRSDRSHLRTLSRGVTQPLPRDQRDPGTFGGGGTSLEILAPSGANNT